MNRLEARNDSHLWTEPQMNNIGCILDGVKRVIPKTVLGESSQLCLPDINGRKGPCELKVSIGPKESWVELFARSVPTAYIRVYYSDNPLFSEEPPFIEILRKIRVEKGYEGYGFGTGLFFAADYVAVRAMQLLGYHMEKRWIFAVARDDSRANSPKLTRDNWANNLAEMAGFVRDQKTLDKYVDERNLDVYLDRVAVKVYQDMDRGIYIHGGRYDLSRL